MPNFEFSCKNCHKSYSELAKFDKTGKYKTVACPFCKSKKKTPLISAPAYAFGNPVGTGKWNNSKTGHDYRFKHNIPNVQQERARAEQNSHMGSNPYGDLNDLGLDTGIHDVDSRPGLS